MEYHKKRYQKNKNHKKAYNTEYAKMYITEEDRKRYNRTRYQKEENKKKKAERNRLYREKQKKQKVIIDF